MWKMNLNICITQVEGTYVKVTELTDNQQYLPDGSGLIAKNRFAYKDTASIDVFKLNTSNKIEYTYPIIVDRNNPKDIKISLNKDGWFTAIHIVVPTRQWVYRELSKQGSIIHTYDIVYFVDNGEIYTYTNGKIEKSSLLQILNETKKNTTISRADSDYVSIRLLNKISDDLYIKLFENRMYNGGCKTDACEANRLEAIINLIKHYVRWGQLAEAERVIEKSRYFKSVELNSTPQYKKLQECGCQ